jgi:hypothetical protein
VSIPGFAIAHGRLAPGKELPPAIAEPARGPTVPIKGSTNDHNGCWEVLLIEAVETSDGYSRTITKKRSRDKEGCHRIGISKRTVARSILDVAQDSERISLLQVVIPHELLCASSEYPARSNARYNTERADTPREVRTTDSPSPLSSLAST